MSALHLGTVVRAPAIVRAEARPDGVCILTLDDPGETHNTITPQLAAELSAALDVAAADANVKAIVLRSAKASFLVGANLDYVRSIRFAQDAEDASLEAGKRFARIAASEKPVVACVHGAALGGGFELALACAAAVVTDHPSTTLGLPEVKLGLMPAANGLLRVADRAGLRVAIDLGLTGRSLVPHQAAALGLVDDVVPTRRALEAACALALRLGREATLRGRARRPRRAIGGSLAGSMERLLLEQNALGRALLFRRARAVAAAKTRGHYPAPGYMLDVLEALGAGRPGSRRFRKAAALEARLFGELVVSETSHRLVELFFASTAAKKEPADLAAFAKRLLARYADEAQHLVREGNAIDFIDDALVDWGFPRGPSYLLEPGAATKPPAAPPYRRPMPDEISLRCSIAIVNEALRCLEEGVVRSARDGDVGAISSMRFPPFRGGPFRYVDVLGAPEILRRTRSLEQRLGPRFEPAPLLVEMARKGKRFYE